MKHYFIAGFDFGTSYSKVVIRDEMSNVAKVATFGADRCGLLPSLVWISDGRITGPGASTDGDMLPYPKLLAADAASGKREFIGEFHPRLERWMAMTRTAKIEDLARLVLARYFLTVLDGIHAFIVADPDWGDFSDDDPLVVQLAVPSGLTDMDGKTDHLMREALVAATLARARNSKPSEFTPVEDLQAAYREATSLSPDARQNFELRCTTYPEVAAGVQAVLRSPNTPDGKYITLDVGAGTVDLNAFLRRKSEGNSDSGLDYWACRVEPLGASRLILGSTSRRVPPAHELAVKPITEEEMVKRLKSAVHGLMREAFRYQPKKVHGGGNPWSTNTTAYIWGGGAEHDLYERAFLEALQEAGVGIYSIKRIPAPAEHLELPRDVNRNFGRMAIAYGLSHSRLNLEAVKLPFHLQSFYEAYPDYWNETDVGQICGCRANPQCSRCHGTGVITREALAARILTGIEGQGSIPTIPPKLTRFHIALERAVKAYENGAKRGLTVDRYLLLRQISQLIKRPEIDPHSLLARRANGILIQNVEVLGGLVRVLRYSAIHAPGGCRCIAIRHKPNPTADIVFKQGANCPSPESTINAEAPSQHVAIGCAMRKSERGEFSLEITSLKPKLNKKRKGRGGERGSGKRRGNQ